MTVGARCFFPSPLLGSLCALVTNRFFFFHVYVCVFVCWPVLKVSDKDISGEDFFVIFKPTAITLTGNVIIGPASQQYLSTVRVCVCVCVCTHWYMFVHEHGGY